MGCSFCTQHEIARSSRSRGQGCRRALLRLLRTGLPWTWLQDLRLRPWTLLRQEGAEAEPKAAADPYLLYGGYRTYGYGYPAYGYGHGVYYGKREAEAKADPYYYGGYYGHGLGYGYGYGLGYRTYYG